ncbi:PREDICTED: uncharacterized protein LOC109587698 isoform X2 [Amphimedon queenslandica]|uniref:Uncharacterized protein n=1 Tax=Amphimedon queenslandica TaxID=400682 RepID=A0AAN0JRK4_AMPQE|nr:PREDICTED: uncharacterized protein LOC109587698 isoform X2 [Amphimedon queenslandica]|eukprot:XP_019859479.1 PREDICTED: uncharacterized protein LOC109587698 isoform X2 [Amphimedon queenslandica]
MRLGLYCVLFVCRQRGPHSMEQQGKLAHLHDLIESGDLSSLIGFVIRKRGELNDTSVWKNKLMSHFKGRSLNNWALVVQSVNELLHEAGCDSEAMMEQVVMFVCSGKDVQSSDDKILKETFSVLDTLTAEMNCNEILEFLRTDVTVAGRDVVAVVLNDMDEKLPYPVPAIRQALKRTGSGKTQETKNFLLPGEKAPIKRNINSQRRKCEIIYQECFHSLETIKGRLKQYQKKNQKKAFQKNNPDKEIVLATEGPMNTEKADTDVEVVTQDELMNVEKADTDITGQSENCTTLKRKRKSKLHTLVDGLSHLDKPLEKRRKRQKE